MTVAEAPSKEEDEMENNNTGNKKVAKSAKGNGHIYTFIVSKPSKDTLTTTTMLIEEEEEDDELSQAVRGKIGRELIGLQASNRPPVILEGPRASRLRSSLSGSETSPAPVRRTQPTKKTSSNALNATAVSNNTLSTTNTATTTTAATAGKKKLFEKLLSTKPIAPVIVPVPVTASNITPITTASAVVAEEKNEQQVTQSNLILIDDDTTADTTAIK